MQEHITAGGEKFHCCPWLHTSFSVYTQSNKMKKIQLLTMTKSGFTSAVYFLKKMVIAYLWWRCRVVGAHADSGRLWYKNQGGNGHFNIRNKRHSVLPKEWQHVLSFFSANHFSHSRSLLQSFVLLCTSALRQNDVPCWLSGQIIKIQTKHVHTAIFFRDFIQGKMNSPPITTEMTKYWGASFTPPLKVNYRRCVTLCVY